MSVTVGGDQGRCRRLPSGGGGTARLRGSPSWRGPMERPCSLGPASTLSSEAWPPTPAFLMRVRRRRGPSRRLAEGSRCVLSMCPTAGLPWIPITPTSWPGWTRSQPRWPARRLQTGRTHSRRTSTSLLPTPTDGIQPSSSDPPTSRRRNGRPSRCGAAWGSPMSSRGSPKARAPSRIGTTGLARSTRTWACGSASSMPTVPSPAWSRTRRWTTRRARAKLQVITRR